MTLAEYLRSVRTLSPDEVEQVEHEHDVERGPYSPPMEIVHVYGESRQA